MNKMFQKKRVVSCEDGCQEVNQGETRELAAELGSMIIGDFDKQGEKVEFATPGNSFRIFGCE